MIRRILSYFASSSKPSNICPICEKPCDEFMSFGDPVRVNALCQSCESLERHRFLWLFLQQKTRFFQAPPQKMLHVAPEGVLEKKFRAHLGDGYITADLFDPKCDVVMDVCDIQFPENTFDTIYCSHVLEHIHDDRKAIREFYRVLKRGGWAILLVPIFGRVTIEDPSITDPEERRRLFGQGDHVRAYGQDYPSRLQEEGFDVHIYTVEKVVRSQDIYRYGVQSVAPIYFCRKT